MQNVFSAIKGVDISSILTEILAESIPLVYAINTEKARSELIIANILVEVGKLLGSGKSSSDGVA